MSFCSNHRSTLYFRLRLATEWVCTVLPHYLRLLDTILDAILIGISLTPFVSFLINEWSPISILFIYVLGSLVYGASSLMTRIWLLLMVGTPKLVLFKLFLSWFNSTFTTILDYSIDHSCTLFCLRPFIS